MASTKGTARSSRRSESSHRAILTAAFELSGELDYARLSIEGIAARAGVGKQTIYRWWPSKGAVLFDAFLMLADSGASAGPALPDTGDIEADLRTVLRATAAEMREAAYDRPMRALAAEMLHDTDLAREYAERLERPLREAKTERLRSAQRAGQLPEGLDLDAAVDLVWSPLFARWFHRTGPLTDRFADQIVRTALHGLRDAPAER